MNSLDILTTIAVFQLLLSSFQPIISKKKGSKAGGLICTSFCIGKNSGRDPI